MDDTEMEWLQSKDPASCAVWEWLKADCQKRGTDQVRKLSHEDIEMVTRKLGIDSPRFSQISQNLQKLGWIAGGAIRGWSKWQASRTAEEDATRKQLEYWKSEAQRLRNIPKKPPQTSQNLPAPPIEERRGEERSTTGAANWKPSLEWCETTVKQMVQLGADYTMDEAKSAFLALQASGWMWGRNPVTDPRAALERQIQTDRLRKPNVNGHKRQPPPFIDFAALKADRDRREAEEIAQSVKRQPKEP